jgi:bacillithiol biosynthesis cysteine-adding enzyme BshC
LVDAYLAGGAGAFLPEHFGDPAARARSVSRAARPLDARVLTVLREQNAQHGSSSPRCHENLSALQRGAAVVVTGQQVGLFLGPLYTLYKAASAIALARTLARETGTPVVPLFWLQTEDHDLAEIASCALPRDGAAPRMLSVPVEASSRVSIAHACLPEAVSESVAALREELGRLPFAAEHLDRIARAYRPGATWSAAFAEVLQGLFADEGLLVIDPRDARLAACITPVHRRALEHAEPIARALVERCAALTAAGYTPQVHVRAGAPLCFVHAGGAAAARHRLVPCARGYALAGAEAEPSDRSLPELLELLEREPLCFSSSALLRPIVQDTLLPTAAYVGGPAEVDYFAQLAPLYAAFERAMPLVVPRARFRVVEDKTRRALDRLGMSADDAAAPEAELLARLASSDPSGVAPDAIEQTLRARFDAAIDEALGNAEAPAEALRAARDKTQAATHAAAGKLVEKIRNARLHRDEARVREVQRVRHALHPLGEPQERVVGLSYFAARYGERAFVAAVLGALDPLDPRPKDLTP